MVQIINLTDRLYSYTEVDQIHRQTHREVAAGQRPNTAIMVQYEPTFTAGRRTKPEDIPNSDVPVIEADRGGSVTWHGPGQLVCYPIIRLPEPLDVIRYIRAVEQTVIDLLDGYGIQAVRVEGRSGAWILREGEMDRKICAIGIKTADGASMHGLALNINPDLSDFGRIIPCGLADAGVISMANLGVFPEFSEVVSRLESQLTKTFSGPYWLGETSADGQ